MVQDKIAKRYAKSIYDLAVERNAVAQVLADFGQVAQTCTQSQDLVVMLRSPVINGLTKRKVLDKVFRGHVGDMVLTFIDRLAARAREALLPAIAEAFVALYNSLHNISKVEVVTATTLTPAQLDAISARVQQVLGRQVQLQASIDPKLIGGMLLRTGDQQYDASVANALRQLKKQFTDNAYSAKQ